MGDFEGALDEFNRAFGTGDSERFLGFFAEDARVFLHEQPMLVGRDAIQKSFTALFDTIDTSAFQVEYDVMDVHDDRAYVLAGFTETLRPREGGPGIEVDGRLVYFWRQEPDGSWKVTRILTGRASPDRVAS